MPRNRKEYQRKWYLDHPGVAAKYARTHRLKYPEIARAADKKRLYGVTQEWFRDQLVGQAGRCAICGFVMEPGRQTQIDHDHDTGMVRGLLCEGCNHMLGHAKDSADRLIAGADYLRARRT